VKSGGLIGDGAVTFCVNWSSASSVKRNVGGLDQHDDDCITFASPELLLGQHC
jgi:hypothetical protein